MFNLDYDHRDPKLVGVMMPFAAEFNGVFKAIQAGVAAAGFRSERSDNLWLHTKVIQTIVTLICQSGIIIADCSGRNANVFYETGIAHMLGKEVILIAQSMADIPFDLQHLSIIPYLNNGEGLQKLTKDLQGRIAAISASTKRA